MRKRKKLKILYPGFALGLILAGMLPPQTVQALSCPDVGVIFARGSGEELLDGENFREFFQKLEAKISKTPLMYDFVDLDYPAVGVDKFDVLAGAAVSGGEGNAYGESVAAGVEKLVETINSNLAVCGGTRYVLAGYSQGASVITKALPLLDADKIIYVATFGDPKIYLPEGKGIIPPACYGENLSDYRNYVPDCHAYKGLLGSYEPYEPEGFVGKMGTWCNKNDIMCSSHFNINDHVSYVDDGLYEDASYLIYDKVVEYFGIEKEIFMPHDTAILLDTTGSMLETIERYKDEVERLAQKTYDIGGRVALYYYRDLNDPFEAMQVCDFDTCTMEYIESELDNVSVNGGGDLPESLLSASLHAMTELNWNYGSVKSIVAVTDDGFLSPDRDGVTMEDVIELSKRIDPVNIYVVTEDYVAPAYYGLTRATGGDVVTDVDDLNFLVDHIIERHDSLPRVEEAEPEEAPVLTLEAIDYISSTEAKITVQNTGTGMIIIRNDAVLGLVYSNELFISNLDPYNYKDFILVPINDTMRGEPFRLTISGNSSLISSIDDDTSASAISNETVGDSETTAGGETTVDGKTTTDSSIIAQLENEIQEIIKEAKEITPIVIPKAPDTGRPKLN